MSEPTSAQRSRDGGASTPDASEHTQVIQTGVVENAGDDANSGGLGGAWGRARQRISEATGSGASPAGTSTAPTTTSTPAPVSTTGAPAITRRTRKARLRLARLDPWSVMKTVFLFAIAGGIIFFIATWVVWGVINASGVFDSVNKAVNDLVASPGSETTFRLEDYVNTHRILGLAALISAIDVVLITALATLFSFLYNLAATVMGGLEVTLAED